MSGSPRPTKEAPARINSLKKRLTSTIRRSFSNASGHGGNQTTTCSGGYSSSGFLSMDSDELVTGEIDPNVGAKAAPMAHDRIAEVLAMSPFIKHRNHLLELPEFKSDAFQLGTLLGQGGFANVHLLASWNCNCDLNEDENVGRQYVVKSLRAEMAGNPERLAMCAADLVIEGYILSALSHPNIVKLRGMSAKDFSTLKRGHADGLFLLLDYLPITLQHQLHLWQRAPTNTLKDRLDSAVQLASALEYIHSKHFIYRDLKPSNVGFTPDGTLQLFDFGLAVEVPPSRDPNKLYKLAGKKGTPRYMAPEVIKRKYYNSKADVFSYAILLWQLLALEKPFSESAISQEVLNRILAGDMPPLKRLNGLELPEGTIVGLKQLLQNAWSKDTTERPNIMEIHVQLKKVLKDLP